MSAYEKDVKRVLGISVFRTICKEVEIGVIDADMMSDIAYGLNDKVGGEHSRRKACDEPEMRKILIDWYRHEMYDMTQEDAVKKLCDTFKKIAFDRTTGRSVNF